MPQGLVIKSTGSRYFVKDIETQSIFECIIRGKFRIQGIKSTNPIAVGDIVSYQIKEKEEIGVITKISERRNYIIRKATNLSKQSHILAANIDQTLLIVTIAYPETHSLFIDRFLITAEAYNVPAKIIFNKIDLYNSKELEELERLTKIYEDIGYECLHTSVKTGKNIDAVANLLSNKTSLISGNSGVGKSSIVNAINPDLDLKTSEISESHKSGKHTTTFAEMYKISDNGYIIDTPGIRGFGLFYINNEELSHYFPEIFKFSDKCKYYNCTHVHEPGCAVKEAVKNNEISLTRYENYLSILLDETTKHR